MENNGRALIEAEDGFFNSSHLFLEWFCLVSVVLMMFMGAMNHTIRANEIGPFCNSGAYREKSIHVLLWHMD